MARNLLKKDHLNPLEILCTSVPVSMVNTLFIMPADCIKTFYQEYSAKTKNKKFVEFCQQAKLKYGINGLYKGWNIRLLQYLIHSSFTLVVFEELMK
jgi:heme/copper-type cytochrome/quinol oxidase subunit 2